MAAIIGLIFLSSSKNEIEEQIVRTGFIDIPYIFGVILAMS